MTKTERTLLFNICVMLFNVVLGLAIELTIVLLLLYVLPKIPSIADSVPSRTVLPFFLLAGLFIAMILSVKCISWAVKTFHLEDKLDEKAVKRYIHDETDNFRHL